jgi:hypothetical protein
MLHNKINPQSFHPFFFYITKKTSASTTQVPEREKLLTLSHSHFMLHRHYLNLKISSPLFFWLQFCTKQHQQQQLNIKIVRELTFTHKKKAKLKHEHKPLS